MSAVTSKLSVAFTSLAFIAVVVFIGWAISRKGFVIFLNTLSPLHVLIVKWIIIYGFVFFVTMVTNWGRKPTIGSTIIESLGRLMILFALFIAIYSFLSSELPSLHAGITEVSPLHIGSEDGVIFHFAYGWVQGFDYPVSFLWKTWTESLDMAADMTYVIIPLILLLLAIPVLTISKFMRTAASQVT